MSDPKSMKYEQLVFVGVEPSSPEGRLRSALWEILGGMGAESVEDAARRVVRERDDARHGQSSGTELALFDSRPIRSCEIKGGPLRERITALETAAMKTVMALYGDDPMPRERRDALAFELDEVVRAVPRHGEERYAAAGGSSSPGVLEDSRTGRTGTG